MGALINLYFKAEVLKELVKTTEKGIALTIAINDETNTYDQNSVCTWRKRKSNVKTKKEAYVANGSVVWTDGKIVVAKKKEESGDKIMDGIELPF